ncbi:MAG: Holliday junction branch migration protein RuvA [Ignavibacteria bacterium]|nr:Holliday junction branch migration protein RuvA [Ignavibacteria bacterium]MBK9404405.1 Holliday junction branch migration protein RuvA [Ignavibacteria bacterium]
MISLLKGKLIHRNKNEIILDVNGVGYQIFISKKVSDFINDKPTDVSSELTIHTHLDVKENSLTLFGFIDEKEKEMFKLLISVNGIGPKIAHNILTHISFEEIVSLISGSGLSYQIKIPGLGQKKLELISMTLKDKVYKIDIDADYKKSRQASAGNNDYARLEALNALMNLGYMRNDGEKIIREVLKANEPETKLTTEDIIRKCLEYISK